MNLHDLEDRSGLLQRGLCFCNLAIVYYNTYDHT